MPRHLLAILISARFRLRRKRLPVTALLAWRRAYQAATLCVTAVAMFHSRSSCGRFTAYAMPAMTSRK